MIHAFNISTLRGRYILDYFPGCFFGVIIYIIELGMGKLTSASKESAVEPFTPS